MKGWQGNLRPNRPIVREDQTVVARLRDLYDEQQRYRILRINSIINSALLSVDVPRNIWGLRHVYLPIHLDEDDHGRLGLHARAVELGITPIIVDYI